MEVLQNRAVAIFLCAALIVLSSLAGGGASLRALRGQTEAVFTSGGGMGIQSDLGELAAQCYNITVIAGRYLPQTDAGITGVLEKRDALHAAATPKAKHRAAEELTAAATVLRLTLEALDLSVQDQNLLASCAVEIDFRLQIISLSSYNETAADFNRTLGGFPANILGRATGVRPLELYE